MSLNWKEIDLILEELPLKGAQIQSVVQNTFDTVIFRIHKKGETKQILVSLGSGVCRLHETFAAFPKSDKPLRFAQFLNSKIVNGWITEAVQLGDDRIVRLVVKRGESVFKLYIRLWSNAANFIVTDEAGLVLDAMRRLPKRSEITGGSYTPEAEQEQKKPSGKVFEIRNIEGDDTFNKKIDTFYASHKGTISFDAMKEQARQRYEGSLGRITAALERLREKEASFAGASRFKDYGDIILSNIANIKPEDKWLETQALSRQDRTIRIELEPNVSPAAQAAKYYEKYRKAKSGLIEIQKEIEESEQELKEIAEKLERLLGEKNPQVLSRLIKSAGVTTRSLSSVKAPSKKEKVRPGLSFKRGDWLILVGRDASENDMLLRRHVNGNDLWLHARDFHGSYVFIKQRSGKSFPLDIMLDAGNLALFYSKGRNNGEGDLFYTQVKYLRRAKNAPKGLVIPTQEKNLRIKLDDKRLRVLENFKVN